MWGRGEGDEEGRSKDKGRPKLFHSGGKKEKSLNI